MQKPTTANKLRSAQQGVVLIEAMIAILIFSIGVLGIVGMQANMVKNTSDSKSRADASNIAQEYIGQAWLNMGTLPAVPNISALLPNGTLTPAVTSTSATGYQLKVTVTWQAPGETQQHNYTTTANIAGYN